MNPHPTLVNIPPGEWYVMQGTAVLSTLLGSCVAVTAWHPLLHAGGLCHYLLPTIPANARQFKPDARYGVIALQFMQSALMGIAPLREFQFGCYGGSVMFQGNEKIGTTNQRLVQQWFKEQRIMPMHSDMGGPHGRKITLDLNSGIVRVKRLD